MGRECRCEYAAGGERAAVKAHLDSLHLHLSGGKKLSVALADVTSVEVAGDLLKVASKGATFSLKLGAREAALWYKKILSPPSVADKLGFKADRSVVLVGALPHEIADAAKGARATKAARLPAKFAADIAVVLLSAGREEQRIAAAANALGPATALWLVYAKGGQVNGDDIIALARRVGLMDTKVARVSDTHAALRFIKANS